MTTKVFGAAVSPESIVEPMEAITGKDAIKAIKDKQIYYFNRPDDFVASVVGGTALGSSQYLDADSDARLPGASQGRLGASVKALPTILKSGENPHSCYNNDCLGSEWNWTVEDANNYAAQQRRTH